MKDYSFFDIASEAMEESKDRKIKVNRYTFKGVKVENLDILDENNIYKKPKGRYILLDNTSCSNDYGLRLSLIKSLKALIRKWKLTNKSALVLGIGNKDYTPDSLGPEVSSRILPTHERRKKNLYSLSPGVFASTGIESAAIAKAIIEQEKIDYVIAIDSLVTHKLNRLNKVIQITDSGIVPGAGIGNSRKILSLDYLKVPVISIGVATVVSMSSIIKDYISEMSDNTEEKRLLIKNLEDREDRKLFLTTNEIDYTIPLLADVIASGINEIFN